jgi:heme-degrading monooxygenase HmoA
MDDAARFASVTMWLTPEQAQAWRDATGSPTPYGYEVATARGAMTPAAAAALVDWQVDEADAQRFVNRWNAAYHAIEDVFGSRLLQDMTAPAAYTGLHAVTDAARLSPNVLSAEVSDDEGLAVRPLKVERFEVVLLTEAP